MKCCRKFMDDTVNVQKNVENAKNLKNMCDVLKIILNINLDLVFSEINILKMHLIKHLYIMN